MTPSQVIGFISCLLAGVAIGTAGSTIRFITTRP